MSFTDFFWEVCKQWAENVLLAFSDFSDDIVKMFSFDVLFTAWWSDPSGVFGPLISALQKLAAALGRSASRALVQVVARSFPPPARWKQKVIPLSVAYVEVLELITIDGNAVVNFQVPIGLRLYNYIKGRGRLIRVILNPSVERVMGALWARLFKISWLKVLQAVLSVLLQTFAATVSIGLVILAFFFVEKCYADKFFVGRLGQSTARKKVHPVEGGVIRRRAPGGSPP